MTSVLYDSEPLITMTRGKPLDVDTLGTSEFLNYKSDPLDRLQSLENYKIELIKRKIEGLLKLPEKWDGENSKPISLIAASTAEIITYIVSGDYSNLAQFFPTPNGGIQVEWFIDGNELEIEIDENGNATVVSVDDQGTKLLEHDFELRETDILRKIRQEVERLSRKLSK